jgi:RimJ/RimL family protein N-acetyltransferase
MSSLRSYALGLAALRPPRAGDAPALAQHADDREVWRNLRDRFPHPYRLADAEQWIRGSRSGAPSPTWVITVEDRAIGAISLHPGEDVHRRDAEIGFWLGRAWWGRGIASAAVPVVTRHAFEQLGCRRVHACVFAWNLASARVLAKSGYQLEGRLRRAICKDGQQIDAELWAHVC